MKDFLCYLKSVKGIITLLSCFMITFGFGAFIGIGIIGTIIYYRSFEIDR